MTAAPARLDVASVATGAGGGGNTGKPRVSANVATVATVATENNVGCVASAFSRWRTAGAQAPMPPVPAQPPPPAREPDLLARREPERAEPAASPLAAPPPPPRPAEPDAWLTSIAAAIRCALKDGALRVADPAGYLALIRPDGRHLMVAPYIIAAMAEAGVLPELPDPLDELVEDDPVAAAERGAVETEPPLPPEGSVERSRLDAEQAAMVRGLLEASRIRPSCFPGTADRPPPKGSFCSCCGSGRWWIPTHPKTDGTGPSGDWRCRTCRPPARLRDDQIVEIVTQ